MVTVQCFHVYHVVCVGLERNLSLLFVEQGHKATYLVLLWAKGGGDFKSCSVGDLGYKQNGGNLKFEFQITGQLALIVCFPFFTIFFSTVNIRLFLIKLFYCAFSMINGIIMYFVSFFLLAMLCRKQN